MRAPGFWYRPPGIRAHLLRPLSRVWTGLARRRIAGGSRLDPGVPVICVGNLTVGGTGKTPTVIALLEMLQNQGIGAHVLSRGYGGSLAGPVRVDHAAHGADEVGDEPLLLSAFAPVWVARDRAAGARAAVAGGARVILMDDGHQNPALAKSLSIVVVDAARGFGNGLVMPAGPLREPVGDGLARADAVLIVGNAEQRARFLDKFQTDKPVYEAEITPLETGMDWAETRVVAFAGLGHPEKFFQTLKSLRATLAAAHGFDDHAPYSIAVLQRLEREAKALGAQLVTTEKDAVRLPPDFRAKVLVLPVRMRFAQPDAMAAFLAHTLAGNG